MVSKTYMHSNPPSIIKKTQLRVRRFNNDIYAQILERTIIGVATIMLLKIKALRVGSLLDL